MGIITSGIPSSGEFVLFFISITIVSSGCISTKTGGGPLSYDDAIYAYGSELEPLTDEERSLFEEIDTKRMSRTSFGRFDVADSPTVKSQSANSLDLGFHTLGFREVNVRYIDEIADGSGSTSIYTKERLFAPGYPWVYPVSILGSESYLAGSGEHVGDNSSFGIGWGGMYGGNVSMISPAIDADNAASQINAAKKFNVMNMSWILGGMFGWGRVNNGYYMQFLWIAIPLGSAGYRQENPEPRPGTPITPDHARSESPDFLQNSWQSRPQTERSEATPTRSHESREDLPMDWKNVLLAPGSAPLPRPKQ